MSDAIKDALYIRSDAMDEMVRAYVLLMNELQARGHDLTEVMAAGFFALGVACAQGGGIIPEGLLLTDVEPLMHGYNVGHKKDQRTQ